LHQANVRQWDANFKQLQNAALSFDLAPFYFYFLFCTPIFTETVSSLKFGDDFPIELNKKMSLYIVVHLERNTLSTNIITAALHITHNS